jgi:HK97 family phage major capsid protein
MTMITREQAEAIIRQQVVQTIFQDAPKNSTFLSLARKLPNMTSNQTRIRVLDFLPTAYWVSGDTGFKQTSEQAWDNVYLNAEELAVIVPIPEAVFDDAEFDIFGEIIPRVNESIGMCVDGATIFGINRPAGWRADIVTTARQAGNNVAKTADLYADLFETGGVWDKVESSGYAVNGAIAKPGFRADLRGVRDEIGRLMFLANMQQPGQYTLDGTPITFPDNGAFDSTVAQLVIGDWNKAVYAIRQDITVKILDQGVIQDPSTKEIVYNLAQQDMIALRVVFRMGWALPNPATRLDADRTSCPFAYLEPSNAATTQTVTFTVKDNANPQVEVEGANVEVSGVRLKTNASGVAVFNLRAGTYPVKVTKKGYNTTTDSVTVASTSVTKAITLPAQA